MPLLCVGERRSPTQIEDGENAGLECTSIWQETTDSILLDIFLFLDAINLCHAACVCKVWKRVAYDETLWRKLLRRSVNNSNCMLPADRHSWRMEYKRIHYQVPLILSETLTEHTDEVLHVSFAHGGHLFSTTSKDSTLKVWEVGYPTCLKYSKDFRELLKWDFTQFSCFNKLDTLVLVSSVKTVGLMDRRGFVAILSLLHDFEIMRVVAMDPSQLFGAWLDDLTFLGGCLEISLDRFATTVQIEAFEVNDSPRNKPFTEENIDESDESGRALFTFSSETASLIKFLTVADIPIRKTLSANTSITSLPENDSDDYTMETLLVDHMEVPKTTHPVSCCDKYVLFDGEEIQEEDGSIVNQTKTITFAAENIVTEKDDSIEMFLKEHSGVLREANKVDHYSHSVIQSRVKMYTAGHISKSKALSEKGVSDGIASMDIESHSGTHSLNLKSPDEKGDNSTSAFAELAASFVDESLSDYSDFDVNINNNASSGLNPKIKALPLSSITLKPPEDFSKNLIFVTGEFAVALHQLGFKNLTKSTWESLSLAHSPDIDCHNSHMVVNYSNHDIHMRGNQILDKPDHLIDLDGHVTGLCLSDDHRYLFINCRPWIGKVDRTDPWATPDLSPNIEVRVIDLFTMQDIGVRYVGHKGHSPSTMCCFVFLDVSKDYVASGSEDAKGYLWDRHYQCLLGNYEHGPGVVNAVGFSPHNQEYFVTVSDDYTIKVWRSKQLMRSIPESQV
ncbi:hypothetical protein CHS0354_038305 [Potamilus streckersoni]|uniref:F-box domain-containing protein n=1 Tax=Potamilus streckersoni TaxID=2493646 RepID=A0AAE0WC25_9BIVA|nr:hypothetical protein CHS0354_038305 [Potamilus streckersoni]